MSIKKDELQSVLALFEFVEKKMKRIYTTLDDAYDWLLREYKYEKIDEIVSFLFDKKILQFRGYCKINYVGYKDKERICFNFDTHKLRKVILQNKLCWHINSERRCKYGKNVVPKIEEKGKKTDIM